MNVISLCDGISNAYVALQKAGFKDFSYYASEIEKASIAISKYNFPNIVRLGDLTKITEEQIKEIKPDYFFAGSPCQSLSRAGAASGNFCDGSKGVITGKSALFYDCVKIRDWCIKYNPNCKWIFENVRMTKPALEIFEEVLGVNGVLMNSAHFGAQRRVRYFFSNITFQAPPKEAWSKKILRDVLINGNCTYNNFNDCISTEKSATLGTGSGTITGKQAQMVVGEVDAVPAKYYLSEEQLKKIKWLKKEKTEKIGYIETDYNKESGLCASQGTRIYSTDGKQNAIPAMSQGLDYIAEKHPTITTAIGRQGSSKEFLSSCKSLGGIRRLTPIECERLFNLEDNFTQFGIDEKGNKKEIKDGPRYTALGNSFDSEVVKYILSHSSDSKEINTSIKQEQE